MFALVLLRDIYLIFLKQVWSKTLRHARMIDGLEYEKPQGISEVVADSTLETVIFPNAFHL